jgi:hypothetical protein
MSLTHAKLALAAAGLVIWGYGVQTGDSRANWLGIGMLAVAVMLRFFKRRPPRTESETEGDG